MYLWFLHLSVCIFNIICLLFCLNFIHAYIWMIIFSTWSSPWLLIDPLPSSPLPPNFVHYFFLITHQVQFVLLIHSWAWAHPQFDLHITPLKKSDSPSLHSHHWSIAPQLWVGTQEARNSQGVPCSMRNCCLTRSYTGLVKATTAAARSWVQWACHTERTLLHSDPPRSLAFYNISTSSSKIYFQGMVGIRQMSRVWQRSCYHCSLTNSEHLLPKETFVRSSESCHTPRVERYEFRRQFNAVCLAKE